MNKFVGIALNSIPLIFLLILSPQKDARGSNITFSPSGAQLDNDEILEISTNNNEMVTFQVTFDPMGMNFSDVSYGYSFDNNELEFLEFQSGGGPIITTPVPGTNEGFITRSISEEDPNPIDGFTDVFSFLVTDADNTGQSDFDTFESQLILLNGQNIADPANSFQSIEVQPISGGAISLGGVLDNSENDADPKKGSILVEDIPVNITFEPIILPPEILEVNARARARASGGGVRLSILGEVINNSDQQVSLTFDAKTDYFLDVDVPAKGSIFANLNASLFDLDLGGIGIGNSKGAEGKVTTEVMTFNPMTVSVSDMVPVNVPLVGENSGLFARKSLPGELLSKAGMVTVLTEITMGPRQTLIFNNSFDGGFSVPEPSLTYSIIGFSFLALGKKIAKKND
ncbi:MAG: hypothetical protein AB4063_04060 [Crocosphaera sp.]